MVRLVTGQSAFVAPRDIGNPLRVLVVQGQEAGPGLDNIDLKAELQALNLARDSLDAAAKALVAPIEARAVGRAELVDALSETKPTLLWLSGHATENPPRFLLADGSWLSPDDLAAAIGDAAKTSRVVPLYVVLWACKTGLNERFAAPGAAPPFIQALANVGVSAVLATLGPLADDIAPDLAAAVLQALAMGRPLDHAVARGRAALMATQLGENDRDDWACPVVWCVDLPEGEIAWSDATAPAQRQELARRLLPPETAPAELDGTARKQAETWSQHRRVWVTERTNRMASAFQVRSEWLGRVLAQQRINHRMVVALDFTDGSAGRVLRDWAGRVMRVTDDFDDPGRQFRELAALITEEGPEAGWRKLCHGEQFTLALIAPPERDDWLWNALRDAAAAAVVLADGFPQWAAEGGWKAEELTGDPEGVDFDPLQYPLAPGLAVLAFPAAAPDLADIDAAQVEELKNAGLLVETRAVCVMPLSRAVSLVDRLDPGQFTAAHRTAFAMLDGAVARAHVERGTYEALLRARLDHARLGSAPSARSTAAQQLMGYYRHHRRASALLDVFDQTNVRTIGEVWKVSAGWAHLATGSVHKARDLLEDVHDDELEPVEQADRLALLAEVEKTSGGKGSKARARRLLEQALSVLEGEPEAAVKVTRLRIEHELARLTHFIDGDPAAAIPQYRKISAAWQALPDHGLDQAITLRNLAEAEMKVADRGAPGAPALFDTAADDLAMARDLLPPNTGHPVAAELEYLAGRLAVRHGEEERATRCFKQAQSVGLATNHLMLVAIAEARLFWRKVARQPVEEYDPGEWTKRATALMPFRRHSWAARVLIDGDLRSARRLMDGCLKRAAVAPLLHARSLLEANPAFDAGSDRDRIIAACAGLALTGTDQTHWEELPRRYGWFTQWTADRDAATPEKAWEATS
ncbi:CHAT domain-containing protein [Nonomuraea basaltis]|uniref:CHAT domain-containing protein n=1 Tax=Nonomuraea basaltis TaxID=2495887 RepID=UPI00110C6A14|nr:CHAT domain-containing protein [Nonomuraea basaltis]TMR88852.1 CHAT domain-containing protein [Nonomuraea basaltis]